MKSSLVFGLTLMCSVSGSIAQQNGETPKFRSIKIADQKAANKRNESNLNKEALEVGMNFINSRFFSNCNGMMVFKYGSGMMSRQINYFQVLNPTTQLFIGRPITEIDKLNGIEWRGGVTMNGKAIRVLKNKGTSDQAWGDWGQRASGFVTYIEKKNGKWNLGSAVDGAFEDPESCEGLESNSTKQKNEDKQQELLQKLPELMQKLKI